MQRLHLPTEFSQRLSSNTLSAIDERQNLRAELAQQIADFEKNGGKINEIPTGVGVMRDGLLPISDVKGALIAVNRPNDRQRALTERKKTQAEIKSKARAEANALALAKITENGLLITLTEAAAIVGITSGNLAYHIRTGSIKLAVKATHKTSNYYSKADVQAITPPSIRAKRKTAT